MIIEIHNLKSDLKIKKSTINKVIQLTCQELNLNFKTCQIIFVDDETLRNMHEKYLSDPTLTDVMTFNLGEIEIEGEIYISEDRIKENALQYSVSIQNEVCRNIIHGILHLKGFNDIKESEKEEMKTYEDRLLSTINELVF